MAGPGILPAVRAASGVNPRGQRLTNRLRCVQWGQGAVPLDQSGRKDGGEARCRRWRWSLLWCTARSTEFYRLPVECPRQALPADPGSPAPALVLPCLRRAPALRPCTPWYAQVIGNFYHLPVLSERNLVWDFLNVSRESPGAGMCERSAAASPALATPALPAGGGGGGAAPVFVAPAAAALQAAANQRSYSNHGATG